MVFFWSHAPAVVRTLDLEGREEVLLAIPEGWWYYYQPETHGCQLACRHEVGRLASRHDFSCLTLRGIPAG